MSIIHNLCNMMQSHNFPEFGTPLDIGAQHRDLLTIWPSHLNYAGSI